VKFMEKYACNLLLNDRRLNDRKLDEYREIEIKQGIIDKAEGSAMVTIGKTKIIAGVKVGLGDPFPDTPNEGILMVNAEFSPIASPNFETGPPGEDATELARVVDRGLRESYCIDFEKLCITPKEKVLSIFVDIDIINHDGNLIDCAFLASLAALMNTKIPKIKDDQIIRDEVDRDLKVLHSPIEITVCKVDSKFIIDPMVEEENVVDCKLTICVREDDIICALQKQGSKELSINDIKKMVEMAIDKSKELRKLLK
jgi:exosome complex component RRP42